MDDAELVRLRHRLEGLEHPVHAGLDGEVALGVREDVGEIMPLEVLEHHVRRAALEARHVEDLRDVLVADTGGCARLVHEARDEHRIEGHLGQHHLDGHVLPQDLVLREEDDPHAALSEQLHDPVFAGEKIADSRQGHRPASLR